MSKERCKHELITSQCADCRPQNSGSVTGQMSLQIHTLPCARYPGECEMCPDPIKIGQSISRLQGDKYWSHTECLVKDLE